MKFLLTLSTASLMATAAFAADAIVYQPVEEVVVVEDAFSWTGGYIGAHGGYGWGKSHDKNNPEAREQKPKGGFGGLQAGYNWQFDNNIVLGAEADVSFASIKKNWRGNDHNEHDPYYGSDKIGTNGTIRARLGYAVDRFMPFVTGGFAWANTKYSLGCDSTRVSTTIGKCWSGTSFDSSKSKTVAGWTVGAGVEYALTNNWTLKTEYLYKDFGKNTVKLVDPNASDAINNRKFKTTVSEIRFGVNYKF